MRAMIVATLAAALLAAWPTSAQQTASPGWTEYHPSTTFFTTGWQISQPIGSFHDYIGGTSFRGFYFDQDFMLAKNFSAGIRFNWNRYNQYQSLVTQTTVSGGTISGPVFHFADQFALTAVGRFYLANAAQTPLVPFVGLQMGGVWLSTYQQTIDIAYSETGFYFIVVPEVGLIFNFAKGGTTTGLMLAVQYNFTTASTSTFTNSISNAQSLSESIGLAVSY